MGRSVDWARASLDSHVGLLFNLAGTEMCPFERQLFSDVAFRKPATALSQSWFRCRKPPNQYERRNLLRQPGEPNLTNDTYVCLSAASTVCDGVWHCPDGSDEHCILGYNGAPLLVLPLCLLRASALCTPALRYRSYHFHSSSRERNSFSF